MRPFLVACVVSGAMTSCTRAPVPGPDVSQLPVRAEPTVISRTQLGLQASGVTIDADGRRFIWVRGAGLHEVTADGTRLVLDVNRLGAAPMPDFEDVAIIDANRIALVAKNDGFVFDRTTAVMQNNFCYLPGFTQEQDPSAYQLSRSLAYDAQENRLYVQPQTFTGFDQLTGSQIGLFEPTRSEPLEWQTIADNNFIAGGMAIVSRQRTFFGAGTRLFQYDAAAGRFDGWWDLRSLISNIEGLAIDRKNGTLLVLDSGRLELVEIQLDGLK